MDDKYNNVSYINFDINVEDIQVVYEFKTAIENWKYNPVSYPSNALLFFINGEALFYINNKKVHITKNKIIFIPAGVSFRSRGIKDYFHYISIKFTSPTNQFIYPFQKLYDLSDPQYFRNQFTSMLDEWERKSFGYKLKIKSILYNIMNKLVLENINYMNSLKNYYLIKDSIKYMEQNYFNSDLSVEKIAAVSNITSTHFRNLFKEIYKTSPIKYINQIRIAKAIDLLEHSNAPIYEISEIVGYTNVYYFDRIFKRITGLTPTQYRVNRQIL